MELKESCEEVLCRETNIETVLGMLVLGDRHGASKLKEVCVKFLVENCHTVVQQHGWKEMLEPYPALLAGTRLHTDETSYSYFRVKLQQRVRFYFLERSSPLLDIGHRTQDIGHRT